MTNKKAIRVLESIEYYLKTHTNESCEEEHTAIALAIKALEDRPKGEWKPLILKTLNEEGGDIVAYESTCCGVVADKKYQHCPKCLEKMKGSAE